MIDIKGQWISKDIIFVVISSKNERKNMSKIDHGWSPERVNFVHLWFQDPFILYVVVVLGLDSKNLLENGQIENYQYWKLPKMKFAKVKRCQDWKLPELKVGKVESCQDWKLALLKLKIVKIESC